MLCTVPTSMGCQWIRNDWNTAGEVYIGHVSSMDECVELVQEYCQWANIATVHESAADGYYADCWCQTGYNQSPDDSASYFGCWFDETDGDHSSSSDSDADCNWVRNNANTDGEQFVGYVTSTDECVELVQEYCDWANIANVHENAAHGAYADCWCQSGNDQTHDGSEVYLNCWFGDEDSSSEDDSDSYGFNSTAVQCTAHDDCPSSSPLCFLYPSTVFSFCTSCDYCHFCSYGVDSTCGSCGEGYPIVENVQSCSGDSSDGSSSGDDSSETITGDDCEWIRNNYNHAGEQFAGHVSSMEECVELVQDMCEWATIANVHENAAHGYNAECWCQTGNYQAHDNQSPWLNCWIDGSPETTSAPVVCREHDDCPGSGSDGIFCYYTGWDWLSGNYGTCESCDECHWCQDGVDNTCGSCGEGYPVHEDVEFCDGAMDRKLAPFLFIAPFVFAIVLALDQ